MHEINTAAETITSAADSEANIIFGATIDPDLEGEVIITVVATGFDASYFANRHSDDKVLKSSSSSDDSDASSHKTSVSSNDDSVLSDIDTELDETQSDDFHQDNAVPNIWTIEDTEEEEKTAEPSPSAVVTPSILEEDELEKPSFLRRLSKRHKDDDEAQQDHEEK
jgi:hypothetical protein